MQQKYSFVWDESCKNYAPFSFHFTIICFFLLVGSSLEDCGCNLRKKMSKFNWFEYFSCQLDWCVSSLQEREAAEKPGGIFLINPPQLLLQELIPAEGGSEGVALLINNHHTNTSSCFSQSDMLRVWRRYPHTPKHAATQSVYTGHWTDLEAVTLLSCQELLVLAIIWTSVNNCSGFFFPVFSQELLSWRKCFIHIIHKCMLILSLIFLNHIDDMIHVEALSIQQTLSKLNNCRYILAFQMQTQSVYLQLLQVL